MKGNQDFQFVLLNKDIKIKKQEETNKQNLFCNFTAFPQIKDILTSKEDIISKERKMPLI